MTIEQNLQKGFFNDNQIEEQERINDGIDKLLQELITNLLNNQKQFVGKGQSAEVHSLPDNSTLCFKITTHREAIGKNIPKPRIPTTIQGKSVRPAHPPLTEGEFLSKLSSIISPVRVPNPYEWAVWESIDDGDTYYVKEKIEILVMERLNAFSLAEILEGKEQIPKSFDIQRFIKELRDFVIEMHNKMTSSPQFLRGFLWVSREP